MKLTIILVTLFVAGTGSSAEHLPLTIQQNNISFEQCNRFTLRYGFVIKIADIGWYAPNCKSTHMILDADNKIVRFYYHKNVDADFFKNSAEKFFLMNIDDVEQKQLMAAPLMAFNAGYTDIADGEYFDLVHTNGQQLSLYKNNRLLKTSNNSYFSKAYFNIWFGDKPVINKLKKAFKSCQSKTTKC